jgi:hypothetical protein
VSHANRNFIIAYIFLVGLPLLGLAGILKSGRNLSAPISVDGNWKLETAAKRVATLPCGNFLNSVSNNPLSISQSGTGLIIGINGGSSTATGVLEGETIKASFARANSTQAECTDRTLTLSAMLESKLDPRTMSGTLTVEGCTSCVLDFRAVRQPRTTPGGKH